MKSLYYIAIEGPIGVGKTSLSKLIGEKLGARLVGEFEENHFYQSSIKILKDMHFKLNCFLLQRYRQQHELRQTICFKFGHCDYVYQRSIICLVKSK